MSHSLICLLPPTDLSPLEEALEENLAPFGIDAGERRIYLSHEEVYRLAAHYQNGSNQDDPYLDSDRLLPYGDAGDGLSATTIGFKQQGALSPVFLTSLARHFQDWYGYPGGCDSRGAYYRMDDNPDARWISWVIGGTYDGQLYDEPLITPLWDRDGDSPRELRRVRNVRRAREVRFVPEALLTPDGVWHEPGLCLNHNDTHGSSWHNSDSPAWQEHCRYLVDRFGMDYAVLLDYTP